MGFTNDTAWYVEIQDPARRVLAISTFIAAGICILVMHSDIGTFFETHPWWQSALAAVPQIAACIFAYRELAHSGEANVLRRQANDLRRRVAELEEEKAGHLRQIAENTQRPVSQAERKASTLRRHLGSTAKVSEGNGVWGSSIEIAEVNDEHLVALFSPRSSSSGSAWCVYVHCDNLEVVEPPQGQLQIRVLKRYGDTVQLGEITKWADRTKPSGDIAFNKGDVVYYATFGKPGTSDTRSLYVYASRDGTNSFLLEASTGQRVISDNLGVSKRFSVIEIDYVADGFQRRGSGTGGGIPHRLFIR
jgi:hypothetical protein